MIVVFFFKQQTADEMRISDGSSDVCSSDLSWHRDHAKDKKPVLAKALEAAFAGDGATTLGLDPETAARTGAWVPPGMAYGASHDDLPPSSEDRRVGKGSVRPCGLRWSPYHVKQTRLEEIVMNVLRET